MFFGVGNHSQSFVQQIEKKYGPITKKLDDPTGSFHNEYSDQKMRSLVDEFIGDMKKLSQLLAKNKISEPAQHKKLEFIAKSFDEISGVGRGGEEIFAVRQAMSKIFTSLNFDQTLRSW